MTPEKQIPDFFIEEIESWSLATDTLRIGLRAGPVRGAGPKTAVQVPKLRDLGLGQPVLSNLDRRRRRRPVCKA
jgi:hypothetical protein